MVSELERKLEEVFQEEKAKIVELVKNSLLASNKKYQNQSDLQRDYIVKDEEFLNFVFSHGGEVKFLTIVNIVEEDKRKTIFNYLVSGVLAQQEEGYRYIIDISPPTPDSLTWRKLLHVDIEIIDSVNKGVLCLGYQRIGNDKSHYFIKTIIIRFKILNLFYQ